MVKHFFIMKISRSEWILDYGASKYVTGAQNEFLKYKQYPSTHKETVQTTDGTYRLIIGIGTINCRPSINLTSILHVPSFPVNLLSLSALIDQIACQVCSIESIALSKKE